MEQQINEILARLCAVQTEVADLHTRFDDLHAHIDQAKDEINPKPENPLQVLDVKSMCEASKNKPEPTLTNDETVIIMSLLREFIDQSTYHGKKILEQKVEIENLKAENKKLRDAIEIIAGYVANGDYYRRDEINRALK